MSKSQKSLTKDDRCRLCLRWRTNSIEATDPMHQIFIQKVFKIFNLQIMADGIFPTRVCLQCVKETEKYYSFFLKVSGSQNILHNEYNKLQAVHNVSNYNTVNIIKTKPELDLSDFVKKEDEPVKDNELTCSNFEEEKSNESGQPKFFNKDHDFGEDHDYESVLDTVSPVKENMSPTIVDNSLLNLEFDKNTPIELYKNGKLVIRGKHLNEVMKKFFDLRCRTCDPHPQFDSIEAYFNHSKSEHGIKGFVTCCGRNMSGKELIVYHVTRHVQPLAFQCLICKKSYTRPHALRCHLKTHLPEYEKEEKHFICDYCNKKYCAKGQLSLHIRNMHPTTAECLSCPHCNKILTSEFALTSHIKNRHNVKKELCPICGKTVTQLKIHLISHDENAKICCKQCGFIAKNYFTLRIHVRTWHSNNLETFKCDKCEYTSKKKNNFLKHMKFRHGDQKHLDCHQCSFCGKKFNIKKHLQDHLNQHTGERNYTCKYCPRTFASGGNRYSHMKRMHKDQKQQEALEKQQIYNNMLEKQLLEEYETNKINEEILKVQVNDYLTCRQKNQ